MTIACLKVEGSQLFKFSAGLFIAVYLIHAEWYRHFLVYEQLCVLYYFHQFIGLSVSDLNEHRNYRTQWRPTYGCWIGYLVRGKYIASLKFCSTKFKVSNTTFSRSMMFKLVLLTVLIRSTSIKPRHGNCQTKTHAVMLRGFTYVSGWNPTAAERRNSYRNFSSQIVCSGAFWCTCQSSQCLKLSKIYIVSLTLVGIFWPRTSASLCRWCVSKCNLYRIT